MNAVARVSALITMCTLCAKEALVSVPMHHTVATLLVFFPMRATIQLRGLRSSSEFPLRVRNERQGFISSLSYLSLCFFVLAKKKLCCSH